MQMPFEWLVQLVPPLKTRAFSISSSHSVHPNQVHLTVSVVSWTTPFKRERTGLCSAWLAGLDPQSSTGMITRTDIFSFFFLSGCKEQSFYHPIMLR